MLASIIARIALDFRGSFLHILSKIVRLKRKIADVDFSASIYTTRAQEFLISKCPDIDLTILGTQENILMLTRYTNWFCDGTFDSAPI